MAVSTTVMQRRSAVKVETLPVALSVFVVVPLAFVAQQVNSAVQVAKVAVILSSKLLSIPTLLNEIHVHCHEAIETTDTILEPSCTSTSDTSSLERVVAYYELFQFSRPCGTLEPEDIPAGALTHINLAFVQFGDDWKMVDEYGDIVTRVTRLKTTYAGLRVNVAIGGWNFNDPPSATYFSTMAGSYVNRQTFINSLMSYLTKYGLDGVEIDWEYPAATDRGGSSDDTANFVILLAELREAFDATNPGWEITCTLPSSYWYMQNFDLESMQKYVSYFNMMSYDLHGMWDQGNKYTGSYLRGHTNLTEIDIGMDLLWRNNIDPKKVVMGMGFYGRSFTMADSECHTADCEFSAVGGAGPCSQSAGILYYSEIESSNSSSDVQTYYDPVSTVKYNVYNGNQWISYDDAQSWQDKMRYLTGKCISGVMIWALDQDDGMHTALAALLGDEAIAGSLMEGGDLSDKQKEVLTDELAAYTGQNCYVTEKCTDGSSAHKNDAQYVCGTGFSSVATAHAPQQKLGYWIGDTCDSGSYRHICCPTDAMPKNCEWTGAPVRSEFGCTGKCGSDQFQLNIDSYVDASGEEPCYQGDRALCCDGAQAINQCTWTSCQKLASVSDKPTCPSGSTYMTTRYDDGNGDLCSTDEDDDLMILYAQAYCCPSDDVPSNCSWTFEDLPHTAEYLCYPSACDATKLQYTSALDPYQPHYGGGLSSGNECTAYTPPAGENPNWPYCCNPPQANSEKWPVDPKYLWENYYEDTGDDVEWAYVDNYGNNNKQSSPGDEDGDDPYGFVMLDGPAGSIDSSFASTYEFARRSEEISNVKRSLFTTNRTRLDTNFDHVEETHYVFCRLPTGSTKCQNVFFDGAEDTIIRLPEHIGEGPFARLVTIEPAHSSYELPAHHLAKRSAQDNNNPVYKIKIDYDFQAIKRDSGPINMRVDYTNLLDYWEDVTDTPATRRRKRSSNSVRDEHMSYNEWRGKVQWAKTSHEALRKRQADIMNSNTSFERAGDDEPHGLQRRWFGSFKNWLNKMNTVESSSVGYLSQFWKTSLLLFSAATGCPKANAQLNVYLDSEISMDSTYAYYLSGTLVPPSLDGTYAYFGMQPSVYMGLTVEGVARMDYKSERKQLIPTISYPGLAIKGIAAVGPTLDLYGQIRGVVQLSGKMSVGAKYTFEKSEVYWPQGDDSTDYSKINDLVGDPEPVASGLEPSFQASVQASADLDVMVTPEANIGINIGGSSLLGGVTLVDAQMVGFVNTTLRFHADSSATVSGDSSSVSAGYTYTYGIYLLYNLGYGGHATIPFYEWYMSARTLFSSPKSITLYENGDVGSTSTSISTKRSISNESPLFEGGDAVTEPIAHGAPSIRRTVAFDSTRELLWGSTPSYINGTQKHLLKRDDDSDVDMMDVDDDDPSFSPAGALTCPANNCVAPGSSNPNNMPICSWILPELRYNCQFFTNRQITNSNGNSVVVPGICSNVQNFFNNRGISVSTGITLTWDPDKSRQNSRRNAACPALKGLQGEGGGYCSVQNQNIANTLGLPSTTEMVSCDEFPIASSEEGGNFFPKLPTNPTATSVKCVPVYQQTLQGSCHKMLALIEANINATGDANWQIWGSGGKNPNTDWVDTAASWQGLAHYDSYIPKAAGLTTAEYDKGHGGYNHKRNFTLSLADPSGPSDGAAWGLQSLTSFTDGQSTGTDATQVACAINTFDQSTRYRMTGRNGICLSSFVPDPVYGNIASWVQCTVQFTGSTAGHTNSKRNNETSPAGDEKSIGDFGGWKIKSIEIEKDAEVIATEVDFVPQGEWLPVAYKD
ncbi:hypothetical protein AbraCBS73388_003278 [Aspergillus brasiliensis]|uniref:chitinase n=1 Tax=Aspergillus brasiliensis TaxID=319629 RepID=A0A9W5Z235_9EURO|nr:hypothetical protein AbraCBS73388_003278 [Aspergillus brasiliensis]